MEGTVLAGDRVLISTWNYGLRVYGLRFPGLGQPQVGDIMVFNFPQGDTVVLGYENPSYYQWARMTGRGNILDHHFLIYHEDGVARARIPIEGIEVRDISARTPYLARCVAGPGDSLRMIQGTVFLNGHEQPLPEKGKYDFALKLNHPLARHALEDRFGISEDDYAGLTRMSRLPLLPDQAEEFRKMKQVDSIERHYTPRGHFREGDGAFWPIFPNDGAFDWTDDDFGPLWIPKAGAPIHLDAQNYALYKRAIHAYEGHDIALRGERVLIDSQPVTSYTFTQDYYWMMGDSRHRSQDSRYYGFVPFDHIIGKLLTTY